MVELRFLLEATHFYDIEKLVEIATTNGRQIIGCLLYTSDAADEEDSVDLGGRSIIKKKKKKNKKPKKIKKNSIMNTSPLHRTFHNTTRHP